MSNVTNNTGKALTTNVKVLVRSLQEFFPGKDIAIDNIDNETTIHVVNQGQLPIGEAGVNFDSVVSMHGFVPTMAFSAVGGMGIVLRDFGVPADAAPYVERMVEREEASEALKTKATSAAKRTAWCILGVAAVAAVGMYAYGRYARTAAAE